MVDRQSIEWNVQALISFGLVPLLVCILPKFYSIKPNQNQNQTKYTSYAYTCAPISHRICAEYFRWLSSIGCGANHKFSSMLW